MSVPATVPEQRSLRNRLLFWILGGVLALWSATLVAVWIGASHELDELLDGHLAQAAALIAAHGGDEDEIEEVTQAPRVSGDAKRVRWQVWRSGALQRRSADAPESPLSEGRRGFATRDFEGHAWRVYATGELRNGTSVQIAERQSSRRDILASLTLNLAWPMLVALPLLALAVLLAVRASLQPLDRIGATLAARGPLALDPVPENGVPGEVRPLVTALNALLGRVASALSQERRFTADAAHELRTPIAALRAQAQVALASTDEGERRAALEVTLMACDRVAHLLGQLLTLARLDAHDASPFHREADLEALARATMAGLAGDSTGRGDDMELRSAGPVRVQGEPALLEVLLRNLVDNALRYSTRGTQVLVRVERDPGTQAPRLSVEDAGPGLGPAGIARLGERFFRGAPEGPPGTGLGWSIVRRIAALHAAQVVVDRSPELGGLRVALLFRPGVPSP